MEPGSIVTGTVVDIDSEWVTVHAGLKSEGVIPRIQFLNDKGEFSLAVGDQVKVAMESGDDGGALAQSILGAGLPLDRDATAPIDLSALKKGKLYYRIGEVSQITGVKPYVLRYWESEFRLMAPQKSRSKQRLYRRKDIETILHIKQLLYEERYTITGARRR